MFNYKCRLCSSDRALISLYNGKCRNNRDYIRKLVEITTGIKFHEDDVFKCICYSCTVQVYNFYIFRTRSNENEKKLEAHTQKERSKSKKIEILGLDSIDLPDIDELHDILTPWLLSKQKYCDLVNGDETASSKNTQGHNDNANDECDLVDSSTQYESVHNCDYSSQCDIPKATSDRDTQTNEFAYTSTCTQTNSSKTRSTKIQCSLLKNDVKNKRHSKKEINVDRHTQTNGIVTKSSRIQCMLLEDNAKNITKKSKDNCSDSHTQTSSVVTKSSQVQCNLVESDTKTVENKTKDNVLDSHTQTSSVVTKSCRIQCSLLQDDVKRIEKENREISTQTNSDESDKSTENHAEMDLKSEKVHTKDEPDVALPLLRRQSPMKSLFVNIGFGNSSIDSNTSFTSPVADLLKIRNKSQAVVICKMCDQTFYTKGEYQAHKKSHLICKFCKKKFQSMRRTKLHVEQECKMGWQIHVEPVVRLVRLESLRSIRSNYPGCIEALERSERERKRTGRMRSRSASSGDSLYSCCSVCKGSVTFLRDLKLGVDKSVQTKVWFDGGMMSNLFYGNVKVKSKIEKEDVESTPKRRKLTYE